MTEKTRTNPYEPIEVTTHNIYFHEDSPIFSVDSFDGLIATSGCDKTIRLWSMHYEKENIRENSYRTAADSSIRLELFKELGGFTKSINCLRFYHDWKDLRESGKNDAVACKYILAACSDSGKIIVYEEGKPTVVRQEDGDDAYDMCWGDGMLIVGFASGRVEVYGATLSIPGEPSELQDQEAKPTLAFKLLYGCKIHQETIQGLTYNKKHGLLATHGLDRMVKISLIGRDEMSALSTFDEKIDASRGLYKRLLFNGQCLFTFEKGNIVNRYAFPFKKCHLQAKIGPLNAPAVKILEHNGLTFICTKKSVYIFDKDDSLVCIDDITFMTVTDACICDDVLFISAMDGFLVSVKLTFLKQTRPSQE